MYNLPLEFIVDYIRSTFLKTRSEIYRPRLIKLIVHKHVGNIGEKVNSIGDPCDCQ